MSLNIKNERVHALAREAARRSGLSQTGVIEESLRRFLDELQAESPPSDRAKAALDIAADFERRLSMTDLERLSTDGLYDDRGFPA